MPKKVHKAKKMKHMLQFKVSEALVLGYEPNYNWSVLMHSVAEAHI